MAPKVKYPTPEELVADAKARTGLNDVGATGFMEPLGVLLKSLEEEADLSDRARTGALAILANRMNNRLRLVAWRKDNPELANAPVPAPIMITGLVRTGTTALGNVMSLDKNHRPCRMWEQITPFPPPRLETEMQDPRRLSEVARLKELARTNPEQMAMHLYTPDETEEDHDILGVNFAAQHNVWPVPAYRRFWRTYDMRETYQIQKQILQVLQSERPPNRWILKSPHYSFHMEAIRDVYPDVRLIWTHRDPVKVIGSYISFVVTVYPPDAVQRVGIQKIRNDIYEHLLENMRIAVAQRDRMGDASFFDIRQGEIASDTYGALKRIYKWLDRPYTQDFEDTVRAWLRDNSDGAHGRHKYDVAEFGFTPDRIRSDFDFYIKRFGL
jgi:hypothetical protein